MKRATNCDSLSEVGWPASVSLCPRQPDASVRDDGREALRNGSGLRNCGSYHDGIGAEFQGAADVFGMPNMALHNDGNPHALSELGDEIPVHMALPGGCRRISKHSGGHRIGSGLLGRASFVEGCDIGQNRTIELLPDAGDQRPPRLRRGWTARTAIHADNIGSRIGNGLRGREVGRNVRFRSLISFRYSDDGQLRLFANASNTTSAIGAQTGSATANDGKSNATKRVVIFERIARKCLAGDDEFIF